MKLWLVKVPKLEKIYPSGWKIGSLRCKNSQALLFLERIFLFLDLDCQNLATLGFDNCPISEKKNSLSFEFFHLRATSFQPLGTIILSCDSLSFLGVRHWYSTHYSQSNPAGNYKQHTVAQKKPQPHAGFSYKMQIFIKGVTLGKSAITP